VTRNVTTLNKGLRKSLINHLARSMLVLASLTQWRRTMNRVEQARSKLLDAERVLQLLADAVRGRIRKSDELDLGLEAAQRMVRAASAEYNKAARDAEG